MPNDCGIFSRVRVNSVLPIGNSIMWEMSRNFRAPSPYSFYIDVAPTGSGDWTTLNKTAIVDDCSYLDTNRYNYSVSIDQEYRIRLVDGMGDVHYSNPFLPLGDWDKRDYLLAKEIMRKELLNQVKFTGVEGLLLKRRQWGPKCPVCLDHDTDAVINNKCAICFSTGFIGGYFKGIELWVTLTNLRRNKTTTELAVFDPFNRSGRSIAYPYLDTKDIWVNIKTNERWSISNITDKAEVRSVPLVYVSDYKKAPTTDIIYDVPLDSTADITIFLDDTAPNSPIKLDGNDPLNPNNIPIPPAEDWSVGVVGDPFDW